MKIVYGIVLIVLILFCVLPRFFKKKPVKVSIAEAETEIEKLANADYKDRGFIVISGNDASQFVQFALEKHGLVLAWPCTGVYKKSVEKLKAELLESGYALKKEVGALREDVENLQYKEIVQDKDYLYANAGKDSKEIVALTKALFTKVYEYYNFDELKVELVLKNK